MYIKTSLDEPYANSRQSCKLRPDSTKECATQEKNVILENERNHIMFAFQIGYVKYGKSLTMINVIMERNHSMPLRCVSPMDNRWTENCFEFWRVRQKVRHVETRYWLINFISVGIAIASNIDTFEFWRVRQKVRNIEPNLNNDIDYLIMNIIASLSIYDIGILFFSYKHLK